MKNHLENPPIQVIWEDKSENFNIEKVKRVTEYFKKKYNTNNVKIIQKSVNAPKDFNIEKDFNVVDKDFQWSIVEEFIKANKILIEKDKLVKLNKQVEEQLLLEYPDSLPFKEWKILKIEFSNFLSYGENQILDYSDLSGITVIESDPPNFGGKTTLGVDLPLFLFFNKTLKGSNADEVFNLYTDKNEVSVKGNIIIDDEEYVIERKIKRKLDNKGEWKTKTNLDFFKVHKDGSIEDLNGEQRRETENFIKSSIGNESDFLMTILTTGQNLNDLINFKPTARGEILSNFLGLEILKKKEIICKNLYSSYSKSMVSNIYDVTSLNNEIDNFKLNISTIEDEIVAYEKKNNELAERIKKGEKYREDLLNSKNNDIDNDLLGINLIDEKEKLNKLKEEKEKIEKEKNLIKIEKPKKFYDENQHDVIIEKTRNCEKQITIAEVKLEEIKKLTLRYANGIECENCGIKLIEAKNNKEKISQKHVVENELKELKKVLLALNSEDNSLKEIKKQFLEYEKQKLIIDKLKLKEEFLDLKIVANFNLIERFKKQEEKIEKNKNIDVLLSRAKTTLNEINFEKEKILIENENRRKTKEDLLEKIDKNKALILKIREEEEIQKVFKVYLEIFGKSGISKMIMRTMIPFINQELQTLMEDAALFTLILKVNEKNEVEFWMKDNGSGLEKLLISGSGYEKTIASLGLRSVMTKISSLPKPNIVVFDEIFGGVANENMDLVGGFFEKLKTSFNNILIITHNKMVNNWCDNLIVVKKENNISSIIKK